MTTQLQFLELWRLALLSSVRSDVPDLSARQMALLFCVFLDQGPHTVRGLAKTLNISKPAVSRALDRLGELGYIRRERDDLDRRNVLVRRMPKGVEFVSHFAELIAQASQEVVSIPEDRVPEYLLESARVRMEEAAGPAEAESESAPNWVDAVA